MSFTSQIVPIGEGWDARSSVDLDPYAVYAAYMNDAPSLGAEGSSDDAKELFPDTFVDMAKNTTDEEEKKNFFLHRKKKKKDSF